MLVYLDGQLVPHDQARVSPFDHGFLFGDGVYEGLRAFAHAGEVKVVGEARHTQRLAAGLAATGIEFDAHALPRLTRELLAANGLQEAFVYWQVSRGTPDLTSGPVRRRVPTSPMRPTLFGYCTPMEPLLGHAGAKPFIATKRITIEPDVRWHLGHIKSLSLLANVMAAIAGAHRHGADEVVFARGPRDGSALLTEGSFTNIIVVLGQGEDARWLTPDDATSSLLAGVTRDMVLDAEPRLRKGNITEHEGRTAASEIMLVGTTTMITTVTHLDGVQIADGPGPVAQHLAKVLREVTLR